MIFFISDLVIYGVGYHHAGMDVSDRKMIEGLFTAGELPVLCKYLYYTMAHCSLILSFPSCSCHQHTSHGRKSIYSYQ